MASTQPPFHRLRTLLSDSSIARLQSLADAHGIEISRVGRENPSLLITKIHEFLLHPGRFRQIASLDPNADAWLRGKLAEEAPDHFIPPELGIETSSDQPPPRRLEKAGLIFPDASGGWRVPLETALLLGADWARPNSAFRWATRYPFGFLVRIALDLRNRFGAEVELNAPHAALAADLASWFAGNRTLWRKALSRPEISLLEWIAQTGPEVSLESVADRLGTPSRAPVAMGESQGSARILSKIPSETGELKPGLERLAGWWLLFPTGDAYSPWERVSLASSGLPDRIAKQIGKGSNGSTEPFALRSTWTVQSKARDAAFDFKRLIAGASCGALALNRDGRVGKIGLRKLTGWTDLDPNVLDRLTRLALEFRLLETDSLSTGRLLKATEEGRRFFVQPDDWGLGRFDDWMEETAKSAPDSLSASMIGWLRFIARYEGWLGISSLEDAHHREDTPQRSRNRKRAMLEALHGLALIGSLELAREGESIVAVKKIERPPLAAKEQKPVEGAEPPRAILQPNHEALVPLDSDPATLTQWSQIATVQRLDRLCRFQLSIDSVAQARREGWSDDELRGFLNDSIQGEVPGTAQSLLTDVKERIGEVRLAEGRYFMTADADHTAAQIAALEGIKGDLQLRLGERVWLLRHDARLDRLTDRLRQSGLFPLDECGSTDGAPGGVRWLSAKTEEWENLRRVMHGLTKLAARLETNGPNRTSIERAFRLVDSLSNDERSQSDLDASLDEAMQEWAERRTEALLADRLESFRQGREKAGGWDGPNPATQTTDRARLLRFARLNGLKAQIVYDVGAQGKAKPRTVSPLALDRYYLEAYCHLKKSERLFRLDRIESARLLNEAISIGR